MMQAIAYKLSEYKIIEHEYGDLWWESHFGLGNLKNLGIPIVNSFSITNLSIICR